MPATSRLAATRPQPWEYWRLNLKLAGLWPAILSAVAVLAGLLLSVTNDFGGCAGEATVRVVDVIIPLALGWQSALALSPESEPPLELLLAYPHRLPRLLLARLAGVAGLAAAIALVANAACLFLPGGEPFPLAVSRWLAPASAATSPR